MSEFSRVIYQYIGKYRTILRKTLGQSERMKKLDRLKLKSKLQTTPDNEFYLIAQALLDEERRLGADRDASYYSYSGMEHFCQSLQAFMNDYALDQDKVVHRSRISSKYLIRALQLLPGLSAETVSSEQLSQIRRCHAVLAKHADQDQLKQYHDLLCQANQQVEEGTQSLLQHFSDLLALNSREMLDLPIEPTA